MSRVKFLDWGEGVEIEFVKSSARLFVHALFEGCGISPTDGQNIPLSVFLADLGVTPKHLHAVLKRWEAGSV
mgnify:CR=1 FL=1